MSTPAPLFHPEPAALASDSWKQELNARLREHRQRRAESAGTQNDSRDASTPADRQRPIANGSAVADSIAARVAARYNSAPSYQQLLAASAAASAAAAESAALAAFEAQAAFQAHAAAQAVLSDWTDARNERSAADLDAAAQQSTQDDDPFADPFFTTHSSDVAPAADPSPAQPLALHDESPVFPPHTASAPPSLSIEHPEPLPQRTSIPARRLVVERARSLVDAFAEALVPAAQSLPAKLIEFPRELVAPRKHRPRLAEGPLFEQESLSVALRIFEVGGEVGGHAADEGERPAHANAMLGQDTQSAVPAYAAGNHRSSETEPHSRQNTPPMANRNEYDGDDSGSETTPRRRGGFLFGPDTSPQPDNRSEPRGNRSARKPENQTGWGSIRLGEHPAYDPIAPPANEPANETGTTYSPSASAAAPDRSTDSSLRNARFSPASAPAAARDSANESEYDAMPAARPKADPAAQRNAQREAQRAAQRDADPDAPPLHGLAPLSDRCMSALIDGMLVASCFLLALLVFTACTTHPPTGRGAIAVALVVFGALATFYAWLFMTYGGGSTPGMRYARIALCSFADDNPTRKELQNRIPATALALLPLGLGLLWALMDEDKLGWHDRMTRTYQRSYR